MAEQEKSPSSLPLWRLVWNDRRAVFAVLGLALLVRIGIYAVNAPYPPLLKDDSVYEMTAWNLLNGHGFSAAPAPPYERLPYRVPGYAAFIAAVYAVTGRDPNAIRGVQILLSLVTCLLVYGLGTRLLSRTHGLLASAIYATWPAAAMFTGLVLTESNQALLIAAAVYLSWMASQNPRRIGPYVGCAAVLAYATYCRPDYQFLLVALMAMVWLIAPIRSQVVPRALVALVCFAAAVTPWMVSNYYAFGRFIGLASGGGHVLMTGYYEAGGKWGPEVHAAFQERYGADFERRHGRPMTYIDGALPEEDALRMRDFVSFVKADPFTYLKHSAIRFYWAWQPRSWSDAVSETRDFSELARGRHYAALGLKFGMLAWDGVILGFAALGFVVGLREWRRLGLVLIVITYATLIYTFVYGWARYRVPMLPLVAVLASHGVVWLVSVVLARGTDYSVRQEPQSEAPCAVSS